MAGSRRAAVRNVPVVQRCSFSSTDQSMGRGANFRNHEYSRKSWVRFTREQPPERLNTRVIDALKQLNFDGAAVAAMPAGAAAPRGQN